MRIATLLAVLVVGAGSASAASSDLYGDAVEPEIAAVEIVGLATPAETIAPTPSQPEPAAHATQIVEFTVPGPMLPLPSLAPAERTPPPPPIVVARIDLSSQSMHVSISGTPRHTWAISSGRAGYATPRGTFQPQWTARMWYSRKYDYAPMPHAVFFNGGVAVHATSATRLLGRPASHGCIRLAPEHAAQFYRLVQQHGAPRVSIQVVGVAPIGVASKSDRSQSARGSRPMAGSASLGGPSRIAIRRHDGSGNPYWSGSERLR